MLYFYYNFALNKFKEYLYKNKNMGTDTPEFVKVSQGDSRNQTVDVKGIKPISNPPSPSATVNPSNVGML